MKLANPWVIGTALVVIALGAFTFYAAASPGKYDDFAKCISDKGVIFYGAYWCPHCLAEKALFGKSAKYLPYVECSLPNQAGQTQACIQAGVDSYPTWQFADGSRESGELAIEQLAQKTGCTP
ncbi:MAG: hypothetical protein EPN86_06180 [Nanoarchaeota archaeon]|nr:MAG: hypothetical protein EPN86_06180 [Nanoarchaeota archaeon]